MAPPPPTAITPQGFPAQPFPPFGGQAREPQSYARVHTRAARRAPQNRGVRVIVTNAGVTQIVHKKRTRQLFRQALREKLCSGVAISSASLATKRLLNSATDACVRTQRRSNQTSCPSSLSHPYVSIDGIGVYHATRFSASLHLLHNNSICGSSRCDRPVGRRLGLDCTVAWC